MDGVRLRSTLLLLGLVVVGSALLGGLVYLSGPRRVLEELTAVGWAGFLAVAGTVLLSMGAWLGSWAVLLRAAEVEFRWPGLGAALLSGFAISYLTPSMYLGGEPVRAFLVAREARVPMSHIMATVVVERLLAGVALLFFASIGGFFALISPALPLVSKRALGIALGIMAGFLFLAIFSFAKNWQWISRLLRVLARAFPGRGRLLRAAAKVAETEQEIYHAFSHRLASTTLAFLLQITAIFMNYLRPQVFFYFTKGEVFSVPQLSLYFTLNAFLTSFLWITPGGMGVAEGGRIGIFSLLAIPPSGALAYSVTYRFVEMCLVAIGIWLMLRQGLLRLREGRVEVEAKLEEAPPPP
ncbi:MAG TPA: flippase-like domain-containing protein [Candidatus Acetothermia bacterium]|nr:flippase-like domain-containing protein [Candidatus Acetothermia bacterium]